MSYTVAYNVSGRWRYLAEGYDGPGSIWRADIRYFDTIEEAREKAEQLKNEYSRTNRSVKVRILDAWDNDVDTDEHVDIYNASARKMKKFVASDRRNYRVLLGGTEIIIPQSENGNDDSEIEEYVKHVVDDADRAKLLEICHDNWELFGMYMMDVEEMFDEDPEYYKYQIVEWITSLLYNHVYWGKNYTEPYFGITVEVQDMDSEAEDRMYYASAKKMKKSYGNYIDAIENFIVDCADGCYYNAVFDEFSDVLSEDEVMDALGTLMDDNIVCYNEKNEKFEVCTMKNVRKYFGTKNIEDLFDDLEDAVHQWDEGWIDNVMDANFAQAHGNNEDACSYIWDIYENCHNTRVANLCEKILAELGDGDFTASTKKSKVAKSSASLENLVNTHIKEVNGESYGSGYVTDDGWYDDQRYSLASVNEVKIGTRLFNRRSFGGGRDVYEYWKDVGNDISYRIRFIVPNTMSGYTIEWDILDHDGAILGTDSHEVYDADVDNVVQTIIDTVNQCVREAKLGLERIDSGDYLASAKKSYSPDYKDFAGMVQSIRNTGNHRNVFKE